MEAEQAENVPPSPLLQRLAHRHTQPGVVNLSRYSSESTTLPGWIVQRSALVERLQTRYSSRDSEAAGGIELALATAASIPTDRVARSSVVTPAGAIAPSIPVATETLPPSEPLPLSATTAAVAPLPVAEPVAAIAPSTPIATGTLPPSEPLLLSATTAAVAPSPLAVSDLATGVTVPETIAPSTESVGEAAIALTQPTQQYRIRRLSANPTTPAATIQRQAASDTSSAAIAPEATARAKLNDAPAMAYTSASALETAPPKAIAPISTLQPEAATVQARLIGRHALIDQPLAIAYTIAHPSLMPAQPANVAVPIVRPLVQAVSEPAIVQRSTDTNSLARGTELSTQSPNAIALAPSISALPLQPSLIWRREDAVTNDLVQRRRQPELPLAISTGLVPPTIARQTEPTSTPSIDAGSSPSSSPAPPAPMPSGGVNVGQIAEQVSRILFRQLTVERERRGMSQWS